MYKRNKYADLANGDWMCKKCGTKENRGHNCRKCGRTKSIAKTHKDRERAKKISELNGMKYYHHGL